MPANSNGRAPHDPASAAAADVRRRLAGLEQERREAVYEAGAAPPSVLPRDKLPTLDDLTDDGPKGRTARWKVALAVVGALATLAGAVQQLVTAFGR